jgi:hypothetical protein
LLAMIAVAAVLQKRRGPAAVDSLPS